MGKIIKKDGYVYYVEGEKGFETFHNLGKDIDDPMWAEETREFKPIKNTRKKKKKEEDD